MAGERDHTWMCRYCHKEFNTMLDLDDHVATEHKEEEHKQARSGLKPGIEPADENETTELTPGIKAAGR